MFNHSHDHQNFNLYIEGSGSFSPKSLNMAEWMIFFLNRMLFEWLRDLWKEQAHSDIVYLKEF